jgi:hypothetical protein
MTGGFAAGPDRARAGRLSASVIVATLRRQRPGDMHGASGMRTGGGIRNLPRKFGTSCPQRNPNAHSRPQALVIDP